MISQRESYNQLIDRYREASLLDTCSFLLQWDQETYLPLRGTSHRAGQLELLAKLVHEKVTAPEVGELLSACEASGLMDDPLSVEAVNVREIRRKYDRKTRLPGSLVEELARITALAHPVWVEARKNSDFALFKPYLEKIVSLKREQADALGYENSPYDALLDEYEPGEKEANLTVLFEELKTGLIPLLDKIRGSSSEVESSFLDGHFPADRQRIFGEIAAAAIGFDFSSGRLDEVVHPFCQTIGPGDTRITTRYDINDFRKAFFGILHEAGHGIYDQGLEKEHFGTPMGEPVSLGIHESQSRFWENFIGRNRPFWTHFFPRAQGIFHEALGDVSPEDFLRAVNEVKPSHIRVEADEVTYNLHIILRFKLERELISGSLPASDVPPAWNESFRKLLLLDVPDDTRGCLQDTHWASGLFGYFPTYCLGNLYAAQFFKKAGQDIPDLEDLVERGDFKSLFAWLRENIHCHGMRYHPRDLVEKITGSTPGTEPFLDYLRVKYSKLYDF